MLDTKPTYSISVIVDRGEVHFSVGGLWEADGFSEFLAEIDEKALPIVQARKPIHALGDMREFMAQNQETGEVIRNHLNDSQKYGLNKVAIITDSAIVKMQYRRLSAGINVEFFQNKSDALAWLRAD